MVFQKGKQLSPEVKERRRLTLIETLRKKREAKQHANDKTGSGRTQLPTSPPGIAPQAVEPVSSNQKLTEINLKGEYDKMTEVLNPKKEKKDGKEKKYQCSECGATFDNLREGKCPDCGVQLL